MSTYPKSDQWHADFVKREEVLVERWMDALRLLQDGSCRSMLDLLFLEHDESLQTSPTINNRLPDEAEPLLRTFWRLLLDILRGKFVFFNNGYVTDIEPDETNLVHAYATITPMNRHTLEFEETQAVRRHLNFYLIVMHENPLDTHPMYWKLEVFDYCLWHHACGKQDCTSRRASRVPDAIKPMVDLFKSIHPDQEVLPSNDKFNAAWKRLHSPNLPHLPHMFSAAVEYVYRELHAYYPDWELRYLPWGMPYINQPDLEHGYCGLPGHDDFIMWCLPCFNSWNGSMREHQHRVREYRENARKALALAMHPRVGHRSPLYRALSQSPYGGALRQILPQVCNAVFPMSVLNPRNKATKRPRDE